MKGNTFIFVVLPGLCFLPVCFPHIYILLEEAMSWAEAQSYCRAVYTDLATVSSEDESNKLLAVQKNYNDSVWIGLYDDTNSWRWSLQNEGFYGGQFSMWNGGEPNNYGGLEDCVEMRNYGWNDGYCQIQQQFICCNGSGETVESYSYVLVTEPKTWSEAQSYCRQFYTDLVSVRNQTEHEEIKQLVQNNSAWIGLHRDSWKWSDGSPITLTKWIPPYYSQSSYINNSCVVLHQDQWEAHTCKDNLFYVCYAEVAVTQQVVRIKVAKNKSPVNLEDASEDILQQLSQILKSRGLSESTKLTWRKQHAKIFFLDRKEEPKETTCSLI